MKFHSSIREEGRESSELNMETPFHPLS